MGDTSTSNLAFPFIAIWPPEVAENEGLKLGICLCNSIETLCKLWVGPSEVAEDEGSRSGICSSNLIIRCASE